MKILIPIIGFGRAGGYRVLSELATHWQRAGHDVDFLVDQRSSKPYFPTSAGIRIFNAKGLVAEHAWNAGTYAPKGNAQSIFLGMWRALRLVGLSYDVILANHSLTAFPVALAHWGRTAHFYYVQAYEPEYYALEIGWRAKILRAFSALSYSLPLEKITNSPVYLEYKKLKTRQWIPPGIDPYIFYRRDSTPLTNRLKGVVLGVIGRSEPTKGTRFALEAFEKLAQVDPLIKLKVAYGNLPNGWAHDRAEVVVPRNDGELADFYRSVDILLAPGTVQLGAPHYPVLEAMSCGTPVITTGYLPANEMNAWISQVQDSDSIVKAITAIQRMPTPEVRQKLDLAFTATEPYHWSRVASDFMRIFEAHVKGGR